MPMIRRASAAAQKLFGTDHPFATGKFHTDGKRLYAVLDIEGTHGRGTERHVNELARFQYVFEHVITPFFLKLELDGEDIVRYWPLGKDEPILIDPRRSLGKPIDPRSGVPTHVLSLAAQSGEPLRAVAQWYGATEEAICSAVRYEAWLTAAAA